MAAHTTMLHVRIDEEVKTQATEALAQFGLTVSDAVRILLTRVAREGALPVGFTSDAESYDKWFRAKVREAIADSGDAIAHDQVMADVQTLIDRKRRGDS